MDVLRRIVLRCDILNPSYTKLLGALKALFSNRDVLREGGMSAGNPWQIHSS